MSWRNLLTTGADMILPWLGFRRVNSASRTWSLNGKLPPEHGWYRFIEALGREAKLVSPEPQPVELAWGLSQKRLAGYIVGDRFVPDTARVDPRPEHLIGQTHFCFCVEPGLERFARATVVEDREGNLVYMSQQFPIGPEAEVTKAFQDRAKDVDKIPGVTPALDLAFRFLSHDRAAKEKRREELRKLLEAEAKKRAEEERLEKLMKDAGTAVGRRALATTDFESAAREALRVSGAELLDCRQSRNKGEMVVQYRFQKRRLECTVERYSLRVLDAGVCLTDHATGKKGDHFFTLESLPGVISEAMRLNKLVVWRHVDGDDDGAEIDWYG